MKICVYSLKRRNKKHVHCLTPGSFVSCRWCLDFGSGLAARQGKRLWTVMFWADSPQRNRNSWILFWSRVWTSSFPSFPSRTHNRTPRSPPHQQGADKLHRRETRGPAQAHQLRTLQQLRAEAETWTLLSHIELPQRENMNHFICIYSLKGDVVTWKVSENKRRTEKSCCLQVCSLHDEPVFFIHFAEKLAVKPEAWLSLWQRTVCLWDMKINRY